MLLHFINQNKQLQKAFKFVVETNPSTYLPYHNTGHMITVATNVLEGATHYSLSENEKNELVIAGLFHDYNHSGGEFKDDVNIQRAIEGLNEFYKQNDIYTDKGTVISIIEATQYPYVETNPDNLTLQQKIIRDADLMQTYEDNYFQQCILGLKSEFKTPSMDVMLENQIKFLLNANTWTDWGALKYKLNSGRLLSDLAKLQQIFRVGSPTKQTTV